MSDLLIVLNAIGVRRPVLSGVLATGAVNILAAAMRPRLDRLARPHTTLRAGRGLPMGVTPEDLQGELDFIDLWGTDAYGRAFVDEQVALGNIVPADLATYMPRMTRGACTPDIARKMVQIWAEIDVRNVLEAVQTPTLLSYTRNGGRSSSSPSTSRPGCLRRRSRRMSGGGWNPEELPRGLSRSETSSV